MAALLNSNKQSASNDIALRFPVLPIEDSRSPNAEESDEESLDWSLILTPSSSCCSLDSLHYKQCSGAHMNKQEPPSEGCFTGNHKANIINSTEISEVDLSSAPLSDFVDECQKVVAATSNSDLHENSPTQSPKRSSSPDSKQRWDPLIELQLAKLRFSKYSQRTSRPSSLTKCDISKEEPRGAWKAFLNCLLRKPSSTDTAGTVYGAKYLHKEKDLERVMGEYERRFQMPGSYQEHIIGDESRDEGVECT